MQANESTLNPLLEQISGGNSEAVIRIQMGRNVVYKGTAAEAQTNSLTESQIADLAQMLTTPAGQNTCLSSTITISCDGETVFRSTAKDGVTVNRTVNPIGIAPVTVHPSAKRPEAGLEPAPQPPLTSAQSPLTDPIAQPSSHPPVVVEAIFEVEGPEAVDIASSETLPASRTTLSSSEVLMIEMHSNAVGEQTLQWIRDQIPDLKQSQLMQTLQTAGAQFTRHALQQVAVLSQSAADKAIADSIVVLTKQYGGVQDTAQGKRFIYEAEHYKVTVQGTNHYTLSDSQGQTLFAFRYPPLQVKPTAPCRLSLTQSFEILQAGVSLQSTQTKQTIKGGVEALSSLAQSLAGMAPTGTFDRLATLQQQQSAKVAEMLANSKYAISTAGGRMFAGTHFKVFHTPEALRIFATDGRAELLSKVGNQIRSRMNDADLAHTGRVAQTLLKAIQHQVQQQIHTNMHGSSKAGSAR